METECGRPRKSLRRWCKQTAGAGTKHEGYGACRWHGGASQRAERAWSMAFALAVELDVTPEDALLLEVRRSAARARWLDAVFEDAARRYGEVRELAAMTDTEENQTYGLPQSIIDLNQESRRERHHMAQVAKSAIDADVMRRIARNLGIESKILFAALLAALNDLGVTEEQRTSALQAAKLELTASMPQMGAPQG